MGDIRRKHSADFKAKLAFEAIKVDLFFVSSYNVHHETTCKNSLPALRE